MVHDLLRTRVTIPAQNPKQQAFFHAIEDRDESNTLDYLDGPDIFIPDSQTEDSEKAATSQGADNAQLKRKLPEEFDASNMKENIPPKSRHLSLPNTTLKRPTTLEDIRNSVSALFDEQVVPDSQPLLSDEEDGGHTDDDFDITITRTNTSLSIESASSRTSIVNRLLRSKAEEDSSTTPLAFQSNDASNSPGFKFPSLLRRTTNLSTTSNSSKGTSSSSGSKERSVRVGGSKRSNIHYQAYEAERKRAVEAAEQKRKAQLKKTVMASKGRAIMGLLRDNENGFE
jgi:mediator of replication checkpoint protein 1